VHVICCSGNVAGAGSGVSSKMGVTSPVDEVDYDESAVTAIMGLFNVGIEEAVKIYKQNMLAAKQVTQMIA